MNQQNADSLDLRPLAWPLYAMAAMLIVIPFVEMGAQVGWTLRPDVLNWRTGTVGIFSSMIVTPTLGLLLAVVTAFYYNHRWAQIGLTALAALAALACSAALILFTLDALQLRPAVAQQMQRPFTIAIVKAAINFGITSLTLAIMAVGAFRTLRRRQKAVVAPRPRPATPGRVPLVADSR